MGTATMSDAAAPLGDLLATLLLTTDPFRQMAEQAPIGMVSARHRRHGRVRQPRWREITGIDHPDADPAAP